MPDKSLHIRNMCVVTALLMSSGEVIGQCGPITSDTVVAIPFDYYVPQDKGRWITLSATSNDIEWDAVHDRWPTRYKPFKYGDGGGAIVEWRLHTVPANGTLYEGVTLLAVDDLVADPDELFYTPDPGFLGEDPFSYCVVDSSGRSDIAAVTLHVADPANYPMPYGIPDPGFGINESPPDDPPAWPSAEAEGYYFIDSDDPNCTDASSYGYPAQPRCSWPFNATVEAGRKLVLAPSSQPYPLRGGVSWDQIFLNGVAGNEAWIVGDERSPDKPRITIGPGLTTQQLRVRGTGNYRISGIDLDGPNLDNREGADNTVLRYSRVRNFPSTNGGGTTVGLGGGVGVMAFHVNAHDNGIVHPTLQDERDIHAFVGTAQQGYWILDVLCSENAGDCVQLTNNNTSRDVYVGRAVMHSMMENCVDFKDFNNFVVSESDCWDFRRVAYTSGSGGNAQNFYVNDEGVQQGYGYFLNNRSWDTSGQNFGSANVGGQVYFIGNRAFFSPEGVGLAGSGGGGAREYYLNTVFDVRDGIVLFTTGSAVGRWTAANYVGQVARYTVFLSAAFGEINGHDYNIYGETTTYAWGSSSNPNTGDFSSFRSATGFDGNSMENVADERFVDATHYDFRLSAGSDLINYLDAADLAGIAPGLVDLQADLSVGLVDFTHHPRSDGFLDIGANEFPPDGPGSGVLFVDGFE